MRDADVFHRVMTVDVQIALGFDFEIDQAVARNLIEHVIEEADAGRELGGPCAVEVDPHADLRFLRIALDLGDAVLHGHRLAFRASIIRVFSSGVPTVRRRQLASSGCNPAMCLTSTPRAFMPSNARFESGTRTRIMFASLGNGVTPGCAASADMSLARSLRRIVACAAKTSACSSPKSAASALSALTL